MTPPVAGNSEDSDWTESLTPPRSAVLPYEGPGRLSACRWSASCKDDGANRIGVSGAMMEGVVCWRASRPAVACLVGGGICMAAFSESDRQNIFARFDEMG
jgi:hypothetical protein